MQTRFLTPVYIPLIKGCSEYGRATGGIFRNGILGGAMRATLHTGYEQHGRRQMPCHLLAIMPGSAWHRSPVGPTRLCCPNEHRLERRVHAAGQAIARDLA